uniref:Uncharacterized protein n=1 Tax=Xiphophorus couchianus TaxID=32473 RepID=A0A3B5LR47_9TELE
VLNGFDAMKEGLVVNGDIVVVILPFSLSSGVIFSNGNIWKQQRRFALSTLKYFGFGKKSLEPVILDEFTHCAEEIRAYKEKVQAEIDRVIGQSRQPSMEDRANLPYTDAVIHEILRMGNITPLALPHSTNKEVQLGGYTIPKEVLIIPNIASVLFDRKEWETPFTFNPSHFLNEKGKFAKKTSFIPFSAGKRLCLGENLARMELFLFFTSFMQHFTFSMPAGVKVVMDYRAGVTLAPKPYKICITPR